MNCLRFVAHRIAFHLKNGIVASCAAWAFLLLFTGLPGTAHGQIFFDQGNVVEEYSLSGTPINTDLITIQNFGSLQLDLLRLAVDGNDLFVLHNGTISEYTTDGVMVTANVIPSVLGVTAIAASGDKLFVNVLGGRTSPNNIEEFTTAGDLVNSNLGVAFPLPDNMVVSGDNVVVQSTPSRVLPPIAGQVPLIGEFPISGGTANPDFIEGSFSSFYGIAAIGDDLFTTDFATQNIAEFSTSGTLITSHFLPGLRNTLAVASGGNDLFFSNSSSSSISEYTATGTAVNDNLIPGIGSVFSIAVEVPEPGAFGLLVLGGSAFLLRRRGSLH